MKKCFFLLIASMLVAQAYAAADIFKKPEGREDGQGEACKFITGGTAYGRGGPFTFLTNDVNKAVAEGYKVKGFSPAAEAGQGYVVLMCKEK